MLVFYTLFASTETLGVKRGLLDLISVACLLGTPFKNIRGHHFPLAYGFYLHQKLSNMVWVFFHPTFIQPYRALRLRGPDQVPYALTLKTELTPSARRSVDLSVPTARNSVQICVTI